MIEASAKAEPDTALIVAWLLLSVFSLADLASAGKALLWYFTNPGTAYRREALEGAARLAVFGTALFIGLAPVSRRLVARSGKGFCSTVIATGLSVVAELVLLVVAPWWSAT